MTPPKEELDETLDLRIDRKVPLGVFTLRKLEEPPDFDTYDYDFEPIKPPK